MFGLIGRCARVRKSKEVESGNNALPIDILRDESSLHKKGPWKGNTDINSLSL